LIWDEQSGECIPVEERFFTPIHTGPGAHPTSNCNDIRPVPVVQRPGCDVDHPSASSPEVKERIQSHFYSASGRFWPL